MRVSEEMPFLFWYHSLFSLEMRVLLVDVVCQTQLQSEPKMVFSDHCLLVPALPCAHSCCMFTCVWHLGCYLAWHWYGVVVYVPGTYIIWPRWQPHEYACVLIKYDEAVFKHYFPNMCMFEWVLKPCRLWHGTQCSLCDFWWPLLTSHLTMRSNVHSWLASRQGWRLFDMNVVVSNIAPNKSL